eukprot:gnl/MRDRNA2_/MRDRNA2_207115_c0_seq1.p1 gnl/MRDRNA2_/MRDRNA2_207115_c0~~gnl/MRDRNA2_/MRDRNA2_207115_c0_seq1.p1  ORF type:complete len:408 (+),score=120.32 gnl/MRDRNA2_/MRDRNA2_207115_c0_seq1:375-1598(+)
MASQPPKKKAKTKAAPSGKPVPLPPSKPAAHLVLAPTGNKKMLQPQAKGMPQDYTQAKAESSSGGSRFVGQIKHCDESRGIGMIECPEAKAQYGFDVTFTLSPGLEVGDEVSFSVFIDATGKPKVRQLMRWLPPAESKTPKPSQPMSEEGTIPDDDTEPPDAKELAEQLQDISAPDMIDVDKLDEAEALRTLQSMAMPAEEEPLDEINDYAAAAAEWAHLGDAGPRVDPSHKEGLKAGLKKSDMPEQVQIALDALLPNAQTVTDMSGTISSTERPDASLMLLKKAYGWFWSSHAKTVQSDFLTTGAYKSLVVALRDNRNNREISYWVCNTIAGACNGKTPELTSALVKAGAVQVVSEMVKLNDDEALQLAAATALGYLAADKEGRSRIAASGIINEVMTAAHAKLEA